MEDFKPWFDVKYREEGFRKEGIIGVPYSELEKARLSVIERFGDCYLGSFLGRDIYAINRNLFIEMVPLDDDLENHEFALRVAARKEEDWNYVVEKEFELWFENAGLVDEERLVGGIQRQVLTLGYSW